MKRFIATLALLLAATPALALNVNDNINANMSASAPFFAVIPKFGGSQTGGLYFWNGGGMACYSAQTQQSMWLDATQDTAGFTGNDGSSLILCDGADHSCWFTGPTYWNSLTATPAAPPWNTQWGLYVKGGLLVAQYRDGSGVVRYTTLANLAAGSTTAP